MQYVFSVCFFKVVSCLYVQLSAYQLLYSKEESKGEVFRPEIKFNV